MATITYQDGTVVQTIKCAHCKGYHLTIGEVRVCATARGVFGSNARTTQTPSQVHTAPAVAAQAHVAPVAARPDQTDASTYAKLRIVEALIPDGRYALTVPGTDTIKFYVLSTGKRNSRYPGLRFLKAQASDFYHKIPNAETRLDILRKIIQAGVEESALLYGQKIGQCCRCGRKLTSEWRERGIGPECVKKAW